MLSQQLSLQEQSNSLLRKSTSLQYSDQAQNIRVLREDRQEGQIFACNCSSGRVPLLPNRALFLLMLLFSAESCLVVESNSYQSYSFVIWKNSKTWDMAAASREPARLPCWKPTNRQLFWDSSSFSPSPSCLTLAKACFWELHTATTAKIPFSLIVCHHHTSHWQQNFCRLYIMLQTHLLLQLTCVYSVFDLPNPLSSSAFSTQIPLYSTSERSKQTKGYSGHHQCWNVLNCFARMLYNILPNFSL